MRLLSLLFAASAAAASVSTAKRSNKSQSNSNNSEVGAVLTAAGGSLDGKEGISFQDAMLAGASARVFAQLVLHPLEVVRTRTQAFRGKSMPVLDMQAKAALGLKGIIPSFLLSGPAGALQFGALEIAKRWLSLYGPDFIAKSSLLSLFAGFFGAFIAASVRIPQELLKQGCQASVYENCLVALQSIWRTSGLPGFYRGSSVTLARDILWNGLSYGFFVNWKALFAKIYKRECTPTENAIIGALGGSMAALLTQPLDVAKTKIMIQRAGEAAKYKGVFSTVLLLLQEEGPLVLFSGLLTRIVYLAPFASLVFSANEFVKAQLLRMKSQRRSKEQLKKNELIRV